MRFSPLVLSLAATLVCGPVLAQQPPAPPFDPNAVLATLKDLKAKQQTVVNRERANVSASINAAIADPAKYYELAAAAVEFQNGTGNDPARLNDWRKRHAAELRNRDFVDVLRRQLIYLNLTWQHSAGAKTKDQIGALLDYVAQVGRDAEIDAPFYEITRKSLAESVFVPYFQIGPYIGNLKDWYDQPFDVGGIYDKIIFPELRAEKSPRLLECWKDRIQLETTHASTAQNALSVNKFNNVRLPTLLWNRAEDELLLGMNGQAVGDMLALIKAHPDHPDFDRWTARLTEIVSPPKTDASPAAGTALLPTPAQ